MRGRISSEFDNVFEDKLKKRRGGGGGLFRPFFYCVPCSLFDLWGFFLGFDATLSLGTLVMFSNNRFYITVRVVRGFFTEVR